MHWVTAGRSCPVGRPMLLGPEARAAPFAGWPRGDVGGYPRTDAARRGLLPEPGGSLVVAAALAGHRRPCPTMAEVCGSMRLSRSGPVAGPSPVHAEVVRWRRVPGLLVDRLHRGGLSPASDGFFVGRAEHASGVDAVLLGELAGTDLDSSLVEDCLHGLKDVLSAGRRRGIRVLLATHHHLDNLAQFNWRQIFGLLNLVDFDFPSWAIVSKPRIQISERTDERSGERR